MLGFLASLWPFGGPKNRSSKQQNNEFQNKQRLLKSKVEAPQYQAAGVKPASSRPVQIDARMEQQRAASSSGASQVSITGDTPSRILAAAGYMQSGGMVVGNRDTDEGDLKGFYATARDVVKPAITKTERMDAEYETGYMQRVMQSDFRLQFDGEQMHTRQLADDSGKLAKYYSEETTQNNSNPSGYRTASMRHWGVPAHALIGKLDHI